MVKTTWTRFRFIAERQDLLYLLDKVLNLRVLSFGHMILLQFAIRLRGDHDRMRAVLQFIYDMLKATGFDVAIPRIINRYHAAMTRGVDAKDAFPIERDLRISVELWLGYCHQAFVYFVTHLSGRITWSTEWLQSQGLDSAFRRAIRENVLNKAQSAFRDLRYRMYEHYVLRRIYALETGHSTYGWSRLPAAKNANDFEGRFRIFTTTVGKTIIFLTEEIEMSAFAKTLKKDDVLINRVPSTNRADVLIYVRRFIPSESTERVIFWFGHSYANNGNRNLGLLSAELCYHYAT
ncbi:hypothetical protein AAVH_14115 [Aphelenchoides avenae]|nr:hypothetical protein AAVH_14115 [Aphelenchus avenae]